MISPLLSVRVRAVRLSASMRRERRGIRVRAAACNPLLRVQSHYRFISHAKVERTHVQ